MGCAPSKWRKERSERLKYSEQELQQSRGVTEAPRITVLCPESSQLQWGSEAVCGDIRPWYGISTEEAGEEGRLKVKIPQSYKVSLRPPGHRVRPCLIKTQQQMKYSGIVTRFASDPNDCHHQHLFLVWLLKLYNSGPDSWLLWTIHS